MCETVHIRLSNKIGAKIIAPQKAWTYSREDVQNWRGVPEFENDVFVETGKVTTVVVGV